ncbi:hypothetical protein ACNKHO_07530 [Shigella flexneri]
MTMVGELQTPSSPKRRSGIFGGFLLRMVPVKPAVRTDLRGVRTACWSRFNPS